MTVPLSYPAEPLEVSGRPVGPASNGARLERLREGCGDETLFLCPGAACDPNELLPLVSALVGRQHVYGLALTLRDQGPQPVAGLESMAERALGAIRELQPEGPYLLGGYSFGGLLALELAQQLTAAGERVGQLFLIDAVYGERHWPRRVWLGALTRRTGRHLSQIARMRPKEAIPELRLRSDRLFDRLKARRSVEPSVMPQKTGDLTPLEDQSLTALAEYHPRHYAGTITLIAPSEDRHFGCDTTRIWEGYADRILIDRIEGDHLTVMQDQARASAVAAAIDRRLESGPEHPTGLRPTPGFERPLVVTTMRWFSAARLAHSLIEAGFAVSACRPRRHAMEAVDGLVADYHLNRLWRRRSLLAAIRKAQPDIILPDDERSLSLLRRLHSDVRIDDPQLANLIAHSLGGDWSTVSSRTAFAAEARAMTIAAPETARIADFEELEHWAERKTYPIVLKTDGSWGGRGVAIVREASQLPRSWRKISGPPSLARALKRALFNLEAGHLFAWVRRIRPVVNAQEFVDGREATVTSACLDGDVQMLRCFEVVQVTEPRGPAAVVRIVDHPEMDRAARRLVERYGLSGFCGFDFILTETGEARLLEVNPRVTPTAHLLVEGGNDTGRIITLFPPAPVSSDASGAPLVGALDVPARAPWLVRRGDAVASWERRPFRRWRKAKVTQGRR